MQTHLAPIDRLSYGDNWLAQLATASGASEYFRYHLIPVAWHERRIFNARYKNRLFAIFVDFILKLQIFGSFDSFQEVFRNFKTVRKVTLLLLSADKIWPFYEITYHVCIAISFRSVLKGLDLFKNRENLASRVKGSHLLHFGNSGWKANSLLLSSRTCRRLSRDRYQTSWFAKNYRSLSLTVKLWRIQGSISRPFVADHGGSKMLKSVD